MSNHIELGMENEFINFGDIARKQLGMQCQYASQYLDKKRAEYYILHKDIRVKGQTSDYHNLEIHKDDVNLFIDRVIWWQKETGQR